VTCGLLLAALLWQCALGLRDLAATYDEHAHLPAGYTYWKTGEIRLNLQHPPLVKLLSAAPLLFLSPRVDWSDPSWGAANEWRFGHLFFYEWGNDADRLLLWGRLPIVLLSLLLGLYVYRWSVERHGPHAGLFSLALYVFCPNVVAHSRFVTMDLALAAFMTASLYHLWRHRRDGSPRAVAWCGLFLGMALATKFSALVLLPVIFGALLHRWRSAPAAPAIVAGVALVVVWAAYLFGDPGLYLKGLGLVNADHPPDHRYYLLGEFRRDGFWHYFAVAFLLKTPIPALIAIAAGVVLTWPARAVTGRDDALLLVPAALFFVATSAFADNLGLRYLLPVFPLLFIVAGRVAAAAKGRVALAAVGLLGAWQAAEALAIHPDSLAYFNQAAGGPGRGYRRLDDSNVDWGQDLKRLKTFLDARGLGPVRLCFHMKGYPPYYGLQAEPMEPAEMVADPAPGVYAISTHCLARVREHNAAAGRELDWLARFTPIGRVGRSTYVFEVR
jgi:4-amino-4-deoxy-L-arabinose transferase-like glycosyltransferase